MKRSLIASVMVVCALLAGCTDRESIGIIGGADGPTKIIVSDMNKAAASLPVEEDYGKEPVRLAKLNGSLYYETDDESDDDRKMLPAEGNIRKTVDMFEIPENDNEANFADGHSWRNGRTENTVEILIDDDWEIFRRIDTESNIEKYQYGYTVEGRLNAAKDDTEFLVLANEQDVTFGEAAYNLLGSNLSAMKDIYVLPVD